MFQLPYPEGLYGQKPLRTHYRTMRMPVCHAFSGIPLPLGAEHLSSLAHPAAAAIIHAGSTTMVVIPGALCKSSSHMRSQNQGRMDWCWCRPALAIQRAMSALPGCAMMPSHETLTCTHITHSGTEKKNHCSHITNDGGGRGQVPSSAVASKPWVQKASWQCT